MKESSKELSDLRGRVFEEIREGKYCLLSTSLGISSLLQAPWKSLLTLYSLCYSSTTSSLLVTVLRCDESASLCWQTSVCGWLRSQGGTWAEMLTCPALLSQRQASLVFLSTSPLQKDIRTYLSIPWGCFFFFWLRKGKLIFSTYSPEKFSRWEMVID